MQSNPACKKATDTVNSEDRRDAEDSIFRRGESSGSEEDVPEVPPPELSMVESLRLGRLSLTEQDSEVAFTQLSLFLHCDTFTLSQRLQVEERARDTAEKNIQRELDEIRNAIQSQRCSSPRCHSVSRHTLSTLPILASSVRRLSKAAERLGAVHQEARTSHAVELMVKHVENLKGRKEPREENEEEKSDEAEVTPRPLGPRSMQSQSRRRISVSVIPQIPLGMLSSICNGSEISRGSESEKQSENPSERCYMQCLEDSLDESGFLDGQETGSCRRWSLRRMTDDRGSRESEKCDTLSYKLWNMLQAHLPSWFYILLLITMLITSCILLSRILHLPSSL